MLYVVVENSSLKNFLAGGPRVLRYETKTARGVFNLTELRGVFGKDYTVPDIGEHKIQKALKESNLLNKEYKILHGWIVECPTNMAVWLRMNWENVASQKNDLKIKYVFRLEDEQEQELFSLIDNLNQVRSAERKNIDLDNILSSLKNFADISDSDILKLNLQKETVDSIKVLRDTINKKTIDSNSEKIVEERVTIANKIQKLFDKNIVRD